MNRPIFQLNKLRCIHWENIENSFHRWQVEYPILQIYRHTNLQLPDIPEILTNDLCIFQNLIHLQTLKFRDLKWYETIQEFCRSYCFEKIPVSYTHLRAHE